MSQTIYLEKTPVLEKTCRACCRFDPNDSMTFHSIFNGDTCEPSIQFANLFKEFLLWDLKINFNDGLPQIMCSDCLDKFVQVKLFREEVLDSQRFLASYLKDGVLDNKSDDLVTIETFPMSVDDSHIGYISPSKLIEYVGSEEEDIENATVVENIPEVDDFEQNESDFLFNHPNQIESSNQIDFDNDNKDSIQLITNCNKLFEEKTSDKEIKSEESASRIINIKCDVCLRFFRSAYQLQRHKYTFHLRSDFTCSICGKKFEQITQRSFHYHVKNHTARKFKCSYCAKTFVQKIHLNNHERTHTKEKPFGCRICGKKFRQNISLQEHLMIHNDPRPFKCDLCAKSFTHRSGLKTHLRLHSSTFQYSCEVCGQGFHQKIHLELHSLNHSGEKPFKCKFCAKSFRQPYQLGNHMHNMHLKKLSKTSTGYQCLQCDEEFTSSSHLIEHQKSHEDNRVKFLCQHCDSVFKTKANLEQHVNAVHLKIKPFNCIHCNRTFTQMSNLNVHLKTHGGENLKCRFCDKTFVLKKTLLMHEAVHTSEKRFKCTFCDESFVYRQTLGSHIMNHFRDENEDEYAIKEEILDDEDFLRYAEDFELNDEFKLECI